MVFWLLFGCVLVVLTCFFISFKVVVIPRVSWGFCAYPVEVVVVSKSEFMRKSVRFWTSNAWIRVVLFLFTSHGIGFP